MQWEVDVPATLSNLGPGFDVLGMAIDRTNTFRFEPRGERGAYWDAGLPVAAEAHAVFQTVELAAEAFGAPVPHGLSLAQRERIPRSRGQGSSATARVAGLLAWRHYTGASLAARDALRFIAELEGHADNAAAALFGGITAVLKDGSEIRHLRFEPPPQLSVVVVVPAVEVSTERARAALPLAYERAEVVSNLGALAWLMHGLFTGSAASLAAGVADRIHHPYRAPLIGPVDAVLARAERLGSAGAFISGSGSTLAAWVVDPDVDADRIGQEMVSCLEAHGIAATWAVLLPRAAGAF